MTVAQHGNSPTCLYPFSHKLLSIYLQWFVAVHRQHRRLNERTGKCRQTPKTTLSKGHLRWSLFSYVQYCCPFGAQWELEFNSFEMKWLTIVGSFWYSKALTKCFLGSFLSPFNKIIVYFKLTSFRCVQCLNLVQSCWTLRLLRWRLHKSLHAFFVHITIIPHHYRYHYHYQYYIWIFPSCS